MNNSTHHASVGLEEFLARVRGDSDGVDAATFAATILGRRSPGEGGPAAFASRLLREYSPDQPRDERGRWTTGGWATSLDDDPDSNERGDQIKAEESTPAAKEVNKLIRASGILRSKLMDVAKNTKTVERIGVILKAVDPKARPQYKLMEQTSKENTETSSRFDTGINGFLPPVPANNVLNLDTLDTRKVDRSWRVVATWHTHPPFPAGEAQPSPEDVQTSKGKYPGIGIQFWHGAGQPDRYDVWMTDENMGFFHVGRWPGGK